MKGFFRALLNQLALLSGKFILMALLFLLALLLQIHLVHDVFADGDTTFDSSMFAFTNHFTSPPLTRVMIGISFLGSDEYLIVAPLVVTLLFSIYKHLQWHGLKVLVISFTTAVLNQLLKYYHQRPRPSFGLQEASGLSFPSGHAMVGGVFYGLMIYIIWETVQSKAWRWMLTLFFTMLILLLGFSRVYLRMHYATDVLAGYLTGLLWLILSLYLLGHLETRYYTRHQDKQ